MNGWTFLTQAEVFTALDKETLELLVVTYNRLRTSNDEHRFAYDMLFGHQGLTGMLLGVVSGKEVYSKFEERRAEQLQTLARRVQELTPVLDDALSRVDATLAGELGSLEVERGPSRRWLRRLKP